MKDAMDGPPPLVETAAFVAVVERGGFRAAALALGVGSATVSKQVARLEQRLGVRLLQRTTRKVATTAAGQLFHARCTHVLAGFAEAALAVRDLDAAPRGLLRVTTAGVLGQLLVADTCVAVARRHPDLRVELSIEDRTIDLVAGVADVAVRVTDVVRPESLIAHRLAHDERVLCASPAYLRKHGKPRSLDDLDQHRCLLRQGEEPGRWRLQRGQELRVLSPPAVFVSNDSQVLRAAAVAGLGVANLPDYVVGHHLRSGELVRFLPEWGRSDRSIWVVHAHGPRPPARVRVFVQALREAYRKAV